MRWVEQICCPIHLISSAPANFTVIAAKNPPWTVSQNSNAAVPAAQVLLQEGPPHKRRLRTSSHHRTSTARVRINWPSPTQAGVSPQFLPNLHLLARGDATGAYPPNSCRHSPESMQEPSCSSSTLCASQHVQSLAPIPACPSVPQSNDTSGHRSWRCLAARRSPTVHSTNTPFERVRRRSVCLAARICSLQCRHVSPSVSLRFQPSMPSSPFRNVQGQREHLR